MAPSLHRIGSRPNRYLTVSDQRGCQNPKTEAAKALAADLQFAGLQSVPAAPTLPREVAYRPKRAWPAPVPQINRPPRQSSRSFFSAGFRQGRRPALKQCPIEGSAFPQPMFFSGDTANQRFLPGSQQLTPRRSSAGWHTRRRPTFSVTSLTTTVYVRTLFADIALLCLEGSHGQRLTARPRDRSPQYRGTDPSR